MKNLGNYLESSHSEKKMLLKNCNQAMAIMRALAESLGIVVPTEAPMEEEPLEGEEDGWKEVETLLLGWEAVDAKVDLDFVAKLIRKKVPTVLEEDPDIMLLGPAVVKERILAHM